MDQLILELTAPPAPSFQNFVVGRNAEVLAALTALAQGVAPAPVVYVWGEAGCGRSHLLSATRDAHAETARHEPIAFLRVVDDVESLDSTAQGSLFQATFEALSGSGLVLASGAVPPASLTLRDDLRSRLGAGLVYRVLPLSDEEKLAAVHARARHLGFELPEDVGLYLLRHAPRDLPTLLRTLDALDRLSAKLKRAITLSLVRECLHDR